MIEPGKPINLALRVDMEFQYTAGGVLTHKGYIRLKRMPWRDVYEHHMVMLTVLGIKVLPRNWTVHHVNRIPWDNRPANLVLIHRTAHDLISRVYIPDANRVTPWDMTAKWYDYLVGRGVSIPDLMMQGVPWYDQRVELETRKQEVPF